MGAWSYLNVFKRRWEEESSNSPGTLYHSGLAVRIGLSLPSMTSRVLTRKISYLHHLLSTKIESIATLTFRILASQNVYDISLVKQCIFLDSKLKTNCTALIENIEDTTSCISEIKKSIISTDRLLMLEEAVKHESVTLASEMNWLRGC